MGDVFSWFHVPNYAAYTLDTWLVYATFGVIGLIMRLSYAAAFAKLPESTPEGVRLNFLGELVSAAACSALIDQNYLIGTLAGIGAPMLIGAALQRISTMIAATSGKPPVN